MKLFSSVVAAIAAGCLTSGCSNVEGTALKPARPVKAQAAIPAAPSAGIRYSAAIEPFGAAARACQIFRALAVSPAA